MTLYCQECGAVMENVPPMLGWLTDTVRIICACCGARYESYKGQHPDQFLSLLLFPPSDLAA